MTRRAIAVALAFGLLGQVFAGRIFAGQALAQPADDLERDDATVAAIAWRLETGNAAFCPRRAPALGVVIEDTAAYDDPASVRATYGLAGDVYVGAVAAGSPAAAAGLMVNTVIARIDDVDVAAMPAPRAAFARLDRVQALLDAHAATGDPVVLTAPTGGSGA